MHVQKKNLIVNLSNGWIQFLCIFTVADPTLIAPYLRIDDNALKECCIIYYQQTLRILDYHWFILRIFFPF